MHKVMVLYDYVLCVVWFCVHYEIFLLLKLESKWNVIISNKHLISSTKSMVTANYWSDSYWWPFDCGGDPTLCMCVCRIEAWDTVTFTICPYMSISLLLFILGENKYCDIIS